MGVKDDVLLTQHLVTQVGVTGQQATRSLKQPTGRGVRQGSYRVHTRSYRGHTGSYRGHIGVIQGSHGVTQGSHRGHIGVRRGHKGGHTGVTWGHKGVRWGSYRSQNKGQTGSDRVIHIYMYVYTVFEIKVLFSTGVQRFHNSAPSKFSLWFHVLK